jgi:hypothetical protein
VRHHSENPSYFDLRCMPPCAALCRTLRHRKGKKRATSSAPSAGRIVRSEQAPEWPRVLGRRNLLRSTSHMTAGVSASQHVGGIVRRNRFSAADLTTAPDPWPAESRHYGSNMCGPQLLTPARSSAWPSTAVLDRT